jgi:hypothetical protein
MIKEHIRPLNQRIALWQFEEMASHRYKGTLFALNAMEEHCRTCVDEIETGSFDVIFADSCALFRTSPIGRLTNLPSVLYLQADSEGLGNMVKQLMENVAETEELRRRGRQHVVNAWAMDKATQRLEQRLAAVIQQSTGDQHVKGQQ